MSDRNGLKTEEGLVKDFEDRMDAKAKVELKPKVELNAKLGLKAKDVKPKVELKAKDVKPKVEPKRFSKPKTPEAGKEVLIPMDMPIIDLMPPEGSLVVVAGGFNGKLVFANCQYVIKRIKQNGTLILKPKGKLSKGVKDGS